MRVTSKGQVTLPKHIRERLGIAPGDDIGFREEGQAVIVEKVDEPKKVNAGEALVSALRSFGDKARREGWTSGVTSDDIMHMTRGPFDDLKSR
jgi:AbrB family looped-hinge helix DNA binding protein